MILQRKQQEYILILCHSQRRAIYQIQERQILQELLQWTIYLQKKYKLFINLIQTQHMEEKQYPSFFSDNMLLTHEVTYQGKIYPVAIYERGRNLGTGAFSDVYQVKQIFSATQKQDEGRELVLKQMKASQPELYFTQQLFQNQIDALQYLKDLYFQKYFIKLQDYWKDQNYFYLIFEKCRNGSLNQLLAATKQYKKPLKKDHILYIAYSILRALQTLHSSNIIHQDIKIQNIMFDDDLCLKLIDFGLASKSPKGQKPQRKRRYGTIIYMAPQHLQRQNCFSQKVDIWSLGVLLYYIIFTKYPNTLQEHEIQGKERFQICQMMHNKIVSSKIDYTSNQQIKMNQLTKIIQLTKSMLEIDTDKRKSARELLGQSIFQNMTVEQEKKIRKDLKQYYPGYFEMKTTLRTKWRKQQLSFNTQIPKQLLSKLQNKKKVQVNEVLHIDKFGFFLLLSNNALYAYFNNHQQLKYHPALIQQIQGHYNEDEKNRINKIKILLYVQEKYFKKKMEEQQTNLLAEQQQNYEHARMPFCSIHKIFYNKNSLFVRISNKTLQVFFESKNPPENQKNERFIKKCLTFNNNSKYPERIYYRKDDRLLEFPTYKDAQQSLQCRKYIDFVREVFRIILDNSCISLKKYGFQLVNEDS